MYWPLVMLTQGLAARRPEGQATRGRVQDLGRRVVRLVTERSRARGRHGPRSGRARRARPGSTPTRGRASVLEWPTSRLTTVPRAARTRDGFVIFPRRLGADR